MVDLTQKIMIANCDSSAIVLNQDQSTRNKKYQRTNLEKMLTLMKYVLLHKFETVKDLSFVENCSVLFAQNYMISESQKIIAA